MVKNFSKYKIFSILWVEKLVFINFTFVSFYIVVTSFINTDIGKQYLTRFSFLQNQNSTYILAIFLFFWLFFLFFSKDSQIKNDTEESELNFFVFISLIFVIIELTILKNIPFTIFIYLTILGLIFVFFDLNKIDSFRRIKSQKLDLVLLTLTVLCIDVNYASDVLVNTFSYTNFQRTGDIEEYLILGNYVIKDGYLIIYKLITLFSFLFFVLFKVNIFEKLKITSIKKLNYLLIIIVAYESLVTTITQNDYYHNAFTMNEFIGAYQNKFPLINYSATYNNIFPYLNKVFLTDFSFELTSIFISLISILSVLLVLGIIKKHSTDNKLKYYYYFFAITISSTLLSRPHYSLRFFFVLLFFYFAQDLIHKTNLTNKVIFIFLMFLSMINNFLFGAPLIIAFVVCEIIYFYKGVNKVDMFLKNVIQFLFMIGIFLFIFRFLLGEYSLAYLTSSTISWGNIFLNFKVNDGLTFHYIAFPLIFYNLSVIFSNLKKNTSKENYISMFLTIYSIGLVPYYFNFQEIYHFLPILLFLVLGIATNNKPLTKNIFYVVFMISIFLTPRLFVGLYETVNEQTKGEISINFISDKNYKEEFFKDEIEDFNKNINIADNEIIHTLDLNNLMSYFVESNNGTIENVPTSLTYIHICNKNDQQNVKYLFNRISADNFKNYLDSNKCSYNIIFNELNTNSDFIIVSFGD